MLVLTKILTCSVQSLPQFRLDLSRCISGYLHILDLATNKTREVSAEFSILYAKVCLIEQKYELARAAATRTERHDLFQWR